MMVRAVSRPRGQGRLRAVVAVFLASGVVSGVAPARGPAMAPRAPVPIVRVLTLEAGSLLVDEGGGRILTVVGQGKRHTLVALDGRAGRQIRSVPLPPNSLPFLVDIDRPGRQLILIVGNARVELRDLDTLRLRRTVDLPLGRDIVGMTAVDGPAGRLFVAAYNPKNGLLPVPLFTVDTRRGIVLRTRMLDRPPPSLEVDERAGLLYLTNQGHGTTLDILDARTGRLLRAVRLDHAQPPSYPTLALDEGTGRVFVLQDDGSIAMVDGRSGRVLRTTQTGGAAGIVADEPAGLVFTRSAGTGLDDGTINVLDAHSGALRRTIGTKLLPFDGPAVDARTGRAFIFLYRRTERTNRDQSSVSYGDDMVGVLDQHSGALVRTVDLGPPRQGGGDTVSGPEVVVDSALHRVLVLDGPLYLIDATHL